jgi:hypothetical protein
MKIHILSGALLTAVLSLSPHQSAFAFPYSVSVQGEVAANESNGVDFQGQQFFTGDLQQPSVNGSASASVAGASASSNVSAALGSLSGTQSVSAVTTGDSTQGQPFATATDSLNWQDQVTITSATFANGTPVELLLTQVLNASMTSAGNAGSTIIDNVLTDALQVNGSIGALQTAFNNGDLSNGIGTVCSGLCSASQSLVLEAAVGQTINIRADLFLNAFASAICDGPSACTSAFAQLDAGHTALTFLDFLTPGASYSTASGVTYFTPTAIVPEPSTILLLGAGLVGLVAWRRKQTA